MTKAQFRSETFSSQSKKSVNFFWMTWAELDLGDAAAGFQYGSDAVLGKLRGFPPDHRLWDYSVNHNCASPALPHFRARFDGGMGILPMNLHGRDARATPLPTGVPS